MLLRACSFALCVPLTAMAEVPKVITDIGPVHGLVSMVTGELLSPSVILSPGDSPHNASLRPSQARDMSRADLVVWVGPALSPALDRQIDKLAPNIRQLTLMSLEETHLMSVRDAAVFGGHDHDHGHDDHDDHAKHDDHDDHDDHAKHDDHDDHDEHAKHDDHDDHDDHAKHDDHDDHDDHAKHDDHDDHDDHAKHDDHDDHAEHAEHDFAHGAADPHVWLDPDNAVVWLSAIAKALSELDPDNADTYMANASNAAERILAAKSEAQETLSAVKDAQFLVTHDAFQYFEDAFDVTVLGAISDSDAVQPGPRRLETLRQAVAATGPICVLVERGHSEIHVETVIDGKSFPALTLDPLGQDATPGADHYPEMLLALANTIASCTLN